MKSLSAANWMSVKNENNKRKLNRNVNKRNG